MFPIIPLYYSYLPSSHFTQKHQTRLWPFSFPLKSLSSSPLQNHHHLRQGTLQKILFWHKISSFLKVTMFLLVFPFSLVRFLPFLCSFLWFSFSVFMHYFLTFNFISCFRWCLFVSIVFFIAFFRLLILGFFVRNLKFSYFYVWLLKMKNIVLVMNENTCWLKQFIKRSDLRL